jgi:hypothetical protein
MTPPSFPGIISGPGGNVAPFNYFWFQANDPYAAPAGATASGGSVPFVTGGYYATVTAIDGTGHESAPSTQSAVVPVPSTCAGSGNCTINWSWNAVSGAVSYNLYITTTPGVYTANCFTSATNSLTQTSVTYSICTAPNSRSSTQGTWVAPGMITANNGFEYVPQMFATVNGNTPCNPVHGGLMVNIADPPTYVLGAAINSGTGVASKPAMMFCDQSSGTWYLGGGALTTHGVLAMSTPALTAISTPALFSPVALVQGGAIQNIFAVASSFTCSVNPTITLEDCGIGGGACSSPTAKATVTLSGANNITSGGISSGALTSGHVMAWMITAGTCTALQVSASGVY